MRLDNTLDINALRLFLKLKDNELGLKITLAETIDSDFIIKLRNSNKARYLNQSTVEIEHQKRWIFEYKQREAKGTEFYFIFWSKNKQIGTIRFIKSNDSTFESGSWLFVDETPFSIVIKAEIFCKDFGFDYCQLDFCYFYVNKNNIQVLRYHNMFHPRKINESDAHLYYILDKQQFKTYREKVLKYCD